MTAPTFQSYVVLIRDQRIDTVGPFETLLAACAWGRQWQQTVGENPTWQTVTLPRDDIHALLALSTGNILDIAWCYAPRDLDRAQARAWAYDHRHEFINDLPTPARLAAFGGDAP